MTDYTLRVKIKMSYSNKYENDTYRIVVIYYSKIYKQE